MDKIWTWAVYSSCKILYFCLLNSKVSISSHSGRIWGHYFLVDLGHTSFLFSSPNKWLIRIRIAMETARKSKFCGLHLAFCIHGSLSLPVLLPLYLWRHFWLQGGALISKIKMIPWPCGIQCVCRDIIHIVMVFFILYVKHFNTQHAWALAQNSK